MFTNWLSSPPAHPIASRWILRFMVVVIVLLALTAGFFQTTLQQERKRYLRLEDSYVRVRDELGVQETQRLIDQSRQNHPESL